MSAAADGNARAVFELAPVRGTSYSYEITIRAPTAAKVEMMGSFTDWEPVALASDGVGNWSVRWNLRSGVHRINVRLDDGEWIAPARTTAMPDDFGGTVGVFVIR